MTKKTTKSSIVLFNHNRVRRQWDKDKKKWYFSIVDVVSILANPSIPKRYWSDLKLKFKKEGSEVYEKIVQLKLVALDGKKYATDCFSTEDLLRVIQSIPSPKAEPFKLWLAKVGKERLDEIQDPELAMKRMKLIYQKKGYPKAWIEKRVRGIAVRNELTDEWKDRGAKEGLDYAILTDEIMKGTFDLNVKQYKEFKGLDKENLRDHMVDIELILTMLAEATTTKLHKDRESQGISKLKKDAKEGGDVAGKTRKDIESRSGKPVTSGSNYFVKAKN